MAEETQFYLSAIDHLKDPSRKTRWRMLLPGSILAHTGHANTNKFNLFEDSVEATDEFALHVKDCKIPDITLTQAAHSYMGFKSNFVTNAKIEADFPFKTILLEDARAYEAILAWHQACINTGLLKVGGNAGTTGPGSDAFTAASGIKLGLGHHKDDETIHITRNNNIKIEMYNWYTGKVIMTVTLINAVPKSVGGWSMDYEEAGGLNFFTFSLHADRWTVNVTANGGNDSNTL